MPTPIADIIQDFQMLDRTMRLELLLEYADKLPPLPEKYHAARDAGLNRVPECQSPVYLWMDHTGGRTHLYADAPREAPTVRGFVSVLAEAFDGADTQTVARVPLDLLTQIGLAPLLGMTRTQGLTAILSRVKRSAAQALDQSPT